MNKRKNNKVVVHSREDIPFYFLVRSHCDLTPGQSLTEQTELNLHCFTRRYFKLRVIQPLLIVPYKEANSSLRCTAPRSTNSIDNEKKEGATAGNKHTHKHQWQNNSQGSSLCSKAPCYWRIYRCTWKRRKQWDKFNQSSHSVLFIFLCFMH